VNKRSLLLLLLALSAARVEAQAPAPSKPPAQPTDRSPAAPAPNTAPAPGTPPAAPVQRSPAAPARTAAPAAVDSAPSAPAPNAARDADVPEPWDETAPLQLVSPPPPPGTTYVPPPGYGPDYAPPASEPQPGQLQPGQPQSGAPQPAPSQRQVRFASPRLYPISPRPIPPRAPRGPRRYGNAGAPFAFGIGVGAIFRDDVGYELFSERDASTGLELFASHDIWAPGSRAIVSAGIDYRNERHEGADDIGVAHNTLQAELNARFIATSWLLPHVRLAAGFVATRFDADDELAAIHFEDHDLGFVGTLGAGFTLRTPPRSFETYRGRLASLSLGLLLEGGYTLASPASLRAKPTGSSDVERVSFSLGELDRGGPYFRTMLVVRL